MATPVLMPQMGLEVTEGIVSAIHVAVGQTVSDGQPLLELETDKALTDVVAPAPGVVQSIAVQVGDTVEIGMTLVVIADAGETEPVLARVPGEQGRVTAAPVARRAAERLGVALEEIAGTGPRGRITLRDVESAATLAAANGHAPAGDELEPLSGTRRAVARRMSKSQQIPQFALRREIDATWLLAEKSRLVRDGAGRLSVNDLLVQALAETVKRHPGLAASYIAGEDGEPPRLRRRAGVDVGLAVATERGLLVPVLRAAGERRLSELAAERSRLVDKARAGRLSREEMSGAAVTLSNLAGYGVDSFTAMLNPGESAILAVGRTVERIIPRERSLVVVPVLSLTLTVDHRVLDGADGAAALAGLAGLLEGGMEWRP